MQKLQLITGCALGKGVDEALDPIVRESRLDLVTKIQTTWSYLCLLKSQRNHQRQTKTIMMTEINVD